MCVINIRHASRYRVERFTNEYLLWSVIHKLPAATRELVVEHGAVTDLIRDKNDFIALHFACRSGDEETVRLLLGEGRSSPLALSRTVSCMDLRTYMWHRHVAYAQDELPLDLALHCRHWSVALLVIDALQAACDADVNCITTRCDCCVLRPKLSRTR